MTDEFALEIQEMLGELDDSLAISPGLGVDLSPELDLTVNNTPNTIPIKADDLKPTDIRKTETYTPVSVVESPQVQEEPPLIDMRKYYAQIDSVTNEILQGVRSDRQEAQDAINLLKNEIDKATGAGQNPARMYVDNFIKALEVKTNINMTAVKAMEAKAKSFAATKVGLVIQNNNQVNNNINPADNATLADILSKPLGPDDEF